MDDAEEIAATRKKIFLFGEMMVAMKTVVIT